jgi:hypothetical protein
MAKQTGPILVKGTIGGINFYKDKDGIYRLRSVGGPSSEEVKTGKNYLNTRRNNAEFKRAVKAGKGIRQGVRTVLPDCTDSTTYWRLHTALFKLLKLDSASAWGERRLLQSNLGALAGFEWNEALPIGPELRPSVSFTAAEVTVQLPPDIWIARRGGQVVLAVVYFDERSDSALGVISQSTPLVFGQPLELSCPLPASGLWVAVLGVTGIGGGGVVVL